MGKRRAPKEESSPPPSVDVRHASVSVPPASPDRASDSIVAPAATASHGKTRSRRPLPTVGQSPHQEPDNTNVVLIKGPRWRRRPPRRIVIRAGIAILLIGASLATNRSYLGWGLFVVVAVLIVPVGRARSFLLSFLPYATVWFLFTALRSLADETVLARTLNTNVARVERWLFGGQLPSVTLQDRFFDPSHLQWYDYFLSFIHWSYFFVPHLVAVRLWQKHPALFRHYLSAMALLLTVGLFIYFLIPSNPPWMAGEQFNSPAAATVLRVMEPVGRHLGGGLYNASYRVIGESNPIAAMPSIHMAITFLLVFPARAFGRRWRLLALFYAACMGTALVYLGEHYVVDIAVGMLVAAYGWFAAGSWLNLIAPLVNQRFSRSRGDLIPAPEASGS